LKAVLKSIDRLLLLKPWWRKLLVLVPVTICFVLMLQGLRLLPGHWKLLAPTFAMSYCALMYWRGKVVSRRNAQVP
jgi:hypothetical protein